MDLKKSWYLYLLKATQEILQNSAVLRHFIPLLALYE